MRSVAEGFAIGARDLRDGRKRPRDRQIAALDRAQQPAHLQRVRAHRQIERPAPGQPDGAAGIGTRALPVDIETVDRERVGSIGQVAIDTNPRGVADRQRRRANRRGQRRRIQPPADAAARGQRTGDRHRQQISSSEERFERRHRRLHVRRARLHGAVQLLPIGKRHLAVQHRAGSAHVTEGRVQSRPSARHVDPAAKRKRRFGCGWRGGGEHQPRVADSTLILEPRPFGVDAPIDPRRQAIGQLQRTHQ